MALRVTSETLEVALVNDSALKVTQHSVESLDKKSPTLFTTQESTEVLNKSPILLRTTQESTEVLYKGVCNDIAKDDTPTPGNWTPTPAHENIGTCISSSLSPSLDEVVISFEPISWLSTYAMELAIKFNKADSGDTPQSDGDEISLVVEFFDGATSIWSSTYLNVQGDEGRIVHPFSAAEKALISASPDLKVSIKADTTSSGTARKIMVCELGLCWSYIEPPSYLRETQSSAEVLLSAESSLRETQSSLEVLHSATPIALRETQSFIEVLSFIPPPAALRETQSSAEVLFSAESFLQETQSSLEVLHSATSIALRETQSFIEVLSFIPPPPALRETQSSTEVLFSAESYLRETQSSLEVLLSGSAIALRETQSSVETVSKILDNPIYPDPYEDPNACNLSSLTPNTELFKLLQQQAILWDPAYTMRLRYKISKVTGADVPADDGDQITVTIKLFDGLTLIATWIHLDVQGDKSGFIVQTLSPAERALILTTPDLTLELAANTTATGDPRRVKVCQIGLFYTGPILPPVGPTGGCRMTMFPHRLLRPLCQ